MQCPSSTKGQCKKLYPNPSAISFQFKPTFEMNQTPKLKKLRKTDSTDDRNSQLSANQLHQYHSQTIGRVSEQPINADIDIDVDESVTPKNQNSTEHLLELIAEKEKKVTLLKERLKNVKHFYQIRIDEQRKKNIERNEVFIGVIQELQSSHNEKVCELKKTLSQIAQEKQQIEFADKRMSNIKSNIEDILKNSQQLKVDNERLQKEIVKRECAVKEKQKEFTAKKQQVESLRENLEQFEKLKLKENRRRKEVLEMIENAF